MMHVDTPKDPYAYEPPSIRDMECLSKHATDLYYVLLDLCKKADRREGFKVVYKINLSAESMNTIKKVLATARGDVEPYGIDIDKESVERLEALAVEWGWDDE